MAGQIQPRKIVLAYSGGLDTSVILPWLKERYPGGREENDGRYLVTFKVADPAWLVREVLQYGVEAEVLEPEGMREAVRRAVG